MPGEVKPTLSGQNKPKILKAILAPGIKNEGPQIFFRARFGFSNIFYTWRIEMSQHFQESFGPP